MAGLLGKIKEDAKKAGQNKSKIFYVREGDKRRVRFLNDVDDGMEVKFHDSFEASINVPCQELFNRDCPYCDSEEVRTRSLYIWSVWDYDAKEVKLFMYAMNNCSPLPALVSMNENYGTITDRDYVISTTGKQQNKSFSVVPMDKAKFRNEKAKPLSEKMILQILDKAFPMDGAETEEEKPTKSSKSKASSSESSEYSDMSAKDLYALCKEKEIEVVPKKPSAYYIEKLEEWDAQYEDDAEEEWDEEVEAQDYSELSPKELYTLCKERDIEVLPKKPAKYYINLLEEYDKANDDWGDSEAGDDDDGEWK